MSTTLKHADDNFCVVFGWMCNQLGLSGNELLVYAIIYGFSQDGESRYFGGRGYLARSLNISKPTVDKALKSLLDKGLICRCEKSVGNVSFPEYFANLQVVKNFYHQDPEQYSKDTLHYSKDTLQDSKDTLPNIDNNTKEKSKEIGNKTYKGSDAILKSVPDIADNKSLYDAFMDFISMRKEMKKPLTDRALKMLVNRCYELSQGDVNVMEKILNQSIMNSWLNVYPLKDDSTARATPMRNSVPANPFTALKMKEGIG